jgi:hypothetical protein
MGRTMSIDVASLLYGSSFLRVSDGSLDSELAFATVALQLNPGIATVYFQSLSGI